MSRASADGSKVVGPQQPPPLQQLVPAGVSLVQTPFSAMAAYPSRTTSRTVF